MITQLVQQLFEALTSRHRRQQPHHRWMLSDDVCTYEIDRDTDAPKTKLLVEYCLHNPYRIQQIADKPMNGVFAVLEQETTSDRYFPVFQAYFADGDFNYGSRHTPKSTGTLESVTQEFKDIVEFKVEVLRHLNVGYNQFKEFFTKSNLPDSQRNAVKALIK